DITPNLPLKPPQYLIKTLFLLNPEVIIMVALCSLGKFESKLEFLGTKHECCESRTLCEGLEESDIRLIRVRSGFNKKLKIICENHFKIWIKDYHKYFRKCCDLFENHGKADQNSEGNRIDLFAHNLATPQLKTESGEKIVTQPSPASFSSQSTNQNPQDRPPEPSPSLDTSKSSKDSMGSDWKPSADPKDLDSLNDWLVSVGIERISVRKLRRQKKYPLKVLDKIKSVMQNFSKDPLCVEVKDKEELEEVSKNPDLYLEIIQQLKEFIVSCKDKILIIKALSVLPKSMSVAKIKLSVFYLKV
ncbi:Extracellular matrix-binding protein ebh, partial [Frankliniella fusca]